jgi:hypothetical protein
MSEPLTYKWRGVHTDAQSPDRREMLSTCVHQIVQCQGDRMKAVVSLLLALFGPRKRTQPCLLLGRRPDEGRALLDFR